VRRLAAEARTASALDHANIATIHEIAETEDGQTFIVMAYYEGETLRERLARGPLDVDEALDILIQLADGLGAAHRAGIVHRDIKPENVMLTGEGRVVILDFGIAKASDADLETGGAQHGTAAYMSPEQSRGEPTDPRSDIWSTGVLLHELLSGSRPFSGDGSSLVHAIREDPPAPLAPGRSGIPPALAELVRTCLAKSPAMRLHSAGELAAALRAIRDGRKPVLARRRKRLAAFAGIAALIVVVVALVWGARKVPADAALVTASGTVAPGIAVLPFDARGEAMEIWREGMVDLLAANLDGVQGLRAIDSRTLLARWAAARSSGTEPDLAASLAVASSLGARFAVLGSIVPNGDELRLAARLHSVNDGALLASFSIDGPADSLFSLVDQLTIKVLAAAWQGQQPTAEVNLGRITTRSLPALKSFLNGERLLRQGNYPKAVAEYRDAVIADTSFAFAYYRLGLAQVWIGETEDSAFSWRRAFHEAVRLSDRLPERERRLVQLALAAQAPTSLNTRAALELAEEAVSRYPDEADAWYFLGELYYHSGDQLLATPDAADSALQRALALDPAMAMLYEHMFENALHSSFDSERARYLLAEYSRVAAPNRVQRLELEYQLAFGDSAARRAALDRISMLPEGERMATIWTFRKVRYGDALSRALQDYPRWQSNTTPAVERLLQLAIDRGDPRRAADYLAAPQLLVSHGALHAYRARLGRLPLPDSVFQAALMMPPAGAELSLVQAGFQVAVAGAVAAEEGRWSEHESALARLGVMAQLARERSDSGMLRYVEGTRTALRGYGLGIRGERTRALPLLVAGQRDATTGESISADFWNGILRWWIGDLLEREGRMSEAATYFGSIWNDPFAAERVAPIYEQLGQIGKARDAYRLVAEAWQDGDPAMQRRAAAAREAGLRLAARLQGD
jgi:TolB-like protein